jgi:glutamine synthetase
MNPYFALSAIFLLGLRGIRMQIPLTLPPVAVMREGRGGNNNNNNNNNAPVPVPVPVHLARSLEEATELFGREGSVARQVFGDGFVEHFKGTREHEVKLWNATVTNWEGMS